MFTAPPCVNRGWQAVGQAVSSALCDDPEGRGVRLHAADSLSCTVETSDIVKQLYGSKEEGERKKRNGPPAGSPVCHSHFWDPLVPVCSAAPLSAR